MWMPITVFLADGTGSYDYGGKQWSKVFSSPLTYLVTLLVTVVILMPRYIWHTMEHVVNWPEFSNVIAH